MSTASEWEFILRFRFDVVALQKLYLVTKTGNNPVLFLQRFGLQDWMPLGLGEVILTDFCDLMERACGTWLNTIALGLAVVRTAGRGRS